MNTKTFPYAQCVHCDEEFGNAIDAGAHRMATLEGPPSKRVSHTTRVVNPTPEEIAQNNLEREIDDAIDDMLCKLGRSVDRGRVSADAVRSGLERYGLEDAWDEFLTEWTA